MLHRVSFSTIKVVFTILIINYLLIFEKLAAILLEAKKIVFLWGFQNCPSMQYKNWEKKGMVKYVIIRRFFEVCGEGG